MIERLQRALEHIEELSPAQEDLARQIEDMTEPISETPMSPLPSSDATLPASVRRALALYGAWSDLQDDDELAFFDRIRHETPPSPPMDEQLAWLDEEETE